MTRVEGAQAGFWLVAFSTAAAAGVTTEDWLAVEMSAEGR